MRYPVLRYIIVIITGLMIQLAIIRYLLMENATFANPSSCLNASLYHQLTGDPIHVDSTQFEKLLDGSGPLYLAADHPKLIQYVKEHVVIPPSTLPYNLIHPEEKNSSPEGQTKRVANILNNKKNGFFIEAGALKGRFGQTVSAWKG
ncbi:unnamed protein product, partial [Meganyctiphanes norvegica]